MMSQQIPSTTVQQGVVFTRVNLKCCLINARSLLNKLHELQYLLYSERFDCLMFTETWLSAEISNGLLDPENKYTLIRCDRGTGKGGGVCVFIRKHLRVSTVNLCAPGTLELLCFDIHGSSRRCRFFVAYCPPASSSVYKNNIYCQKSYMKDILKCIERNCDISEPTYVMGDFNTPDFQLSRKPKLSQSKILYDFCMENSFVECVKENTRERSNLDLLMTNAEETVSKIQVTAPLANSDHSTVEFMITLSDAVTDSEEDNRSKKVYHWKKGDYSGLCQYLNQINWCEILYTNFTPDDIWYVFTSLLNEGIDLFIPHSMSTSNGSGIKHIKSYPRRIRALIARKRCLWRQHKHHPFDDSLTIRYKEVSKECRNAIRAYEVTREQRLIEANNSGCFYRFMNRRLGNSTGVGPLRDKNGKFHFKGHDKAQLLNDTFGCSNVTDDGNQPQFPRRVSSDVTLENVDLSPQTLKRLVRKIRPKLSLDPEGYPSYLLKNAIDALAEPLSLIYNSFSSVAKIPSSWKLAIITPIFKKGLSSDPSNYRPVSLTSNFGKLMERAVVVSTLKYLNDNKLLSDCQHGFLSKRSTFTNLLESVDDWTLALERNLGQAVAYIDFTRAFDSVSHEKLLLKLQSYGFGGTLLQWIKDFLSDRKHCTRVGDALSDYVPIISGVIQGSCLGPLLFLIYINDLPEIFDQSLTVKLYADDVKIYSVIGSCADCNNFQMNLTKLFSWSALWQLSISYSKCSIVHVAAPRWFAANEYRLTYELGNNTLRNQVSVKDLGITIDQSLKFSEHITNICKAAHSRANLIVRCFASGDRASMLKAFKVYVRPIVEYNSSIWSPTLMKYIDMIERVQRKFTKRLPGMKNKTYFQRMSALDIESLEIRRIRTDLITVYKIIFGHINVNTTNLFHVRQSSGSRRHRFQLTMPVNKKAVRHSFLANRIIPVWNTLPLTTNFSSIVAFKNSLNSNFLTRACKRNFM